MHSLVCLSVKEYYADCVGTRKIVEKGMFSIVRYSGMRVFNIKDVVSQVATCRNTKIQYQPSGERYLQSIT